MWPKEVRANRVFLADGAVAYHLHHNEVGELGRILIQPAGSDGCHVTCEVLDRADGRIEERKRVLEPLGQMVIKALDHPGQARSGQK